METFDPFSWTFAWNERLWGNHVCLEKERLNEVSEDSKIYDISMHQKAGWRDVIYKAHHYIKIFYSVKEAHNCSVCIPDPQ